MTNKTVKDFSLRYLTPVYTVICLDDSYLSSTRYSGKCSGPSLLFIFDSTQSPIVRECVIRMIRKSKGVCFSRNKCESKNITMIMITFFIQRVLSESGIFLRGKTEPVSGHELKIDSSAVGQDGRVEPGLHCRISTG